MIETSWIYGFGGGLAIGLAAAMFLLVNGRITEKEARHRHPEWAEE
ncbi:MAG: hypothetical protein ACE5FS_12130 [Paracoccaceae bacterium]